MKLFSLLLGMILAQSLFLTSIVSADETAVRELLNKREIAWERQDVAGLAAIFADDADYIDSSGTVTEGKKAIEEKYKLMFTKAQYKYSRSTQKINKIRFVQPNVAVTSVDWTLTGLKANDEKPLPDRRGTTVLVVVKSDGAWKVSTFHVALFPPS
jgi:uncharacterized protein (TIGR02246 family)